MSIRPKSNPKPRRQTTNKKFETLQETLKNYEAKLYKKQPQDANTSLSKKLSRRSALKSVRSNISPFTKASSKHKYDQLSSASETSIESFAKISMLENSSDARTVESPVLNPSRPLKRESLNYEHELNKHKKQNREIQNKLSNLHKKTVTLSDKSKNSEFKKEVLKEKVDVRCEKQSIQGNKEEIEREFELKHDRIMKKVTEKHQKQMRELEEMISQQFRNEVREIKAAHEQRSAKKLLEVTNEYERKIDRAQEEVVWLRKQNEKFKKKLEEVNGKMETGSGQVSNSSNDLKKRIKEMQKQFLQLQHDYVLLKKEGSSLCGKCKAFTETNNELSSKIHRIRAYIESNN